MSEGDGDRTRTVSLGTSQRDLRELGSADQPVPRVASNVRWCDVRMARQWHGIRGRRNHPSPGQSVLDAWLHNLFAREATDAACKASENGRGTGVQTGDCDLFDRYGDQADDENRHERRQPQYRSPPMRRDIHACSFVAPAVTGPAYVERESFDSPRPLNEGGTYSS